MKTETINRQGNAEQEVNIESMTHNYALNMQRRTGKQMRHHLLQARAAVMLIEKMRKGITEFTFNGQDGMLHKVKGTLIHYEKDFKQTHEMKPKNRFIVYYDTLIKAWRAFQITGLVSITCESKL